jgi:predicted ATPase
MNEPFIQSVEIRNFKSIAHCRVKLGRLNIVVGRNGAGKSNFLDALSFVADAVRTDVNAAVGKHGGAHGVPYQGKTAESTLAIALDVRMRGSEFQNGGCGRYEIEFSVDENGRGVLIGETIRCTPGEPEDKDSPCVDVSRRVGQPPVVEKGDGELRAAIENTRNDGNQLLISDFRTVVSG